MLPCASICLRPRFQIDLALDWDSTYASEHGAGEAVQFEALHTSSGFALAAALVI